MNTEDKCMNPHCIREGGRSFHINRGEYINPYMHGSTQFNDFERGWSQALKRSPGQLLREYQDGKNAPRQQSIVLPTPPPKRKKTKMSKDTYDSLARRAKRKLLNSPSYQPPRFRWSTSVYYIRIEAHEMPLWKIGITSNNIHSRYCVADRRIIVEIKSWRYVTREEAEAIEREVLAEFAADVYEGDSVLRSGGDSELFTRDVLKLDSQEDFLARLRKEKQAGL